MNIQEQRDYLIQALEKIINAPFGALDEYCRYVDTVACEAHAKVTTQEVEPSG